MEVKNNNRTKVKRMKMSDAPAFMMDLTHLQQLLLT